MLRRPARPSVPRRAVPLGRYVARIDRKTGYFPFTPTFPWLGLLGFVPLPTKWSIDFGEPFALDEYGLEAAEDPIVANRISEEVRSVVQGMIESRLARRRSVWFG